MSSRSLLVRRRFQFAVVLSVGALLPWLLRGTLLPGRAFEVAASNTLIANVRAIVIAFWLRLSIETDPGIRRSYVILPSALTGHGIVVVWFLLTRFPTTELSWDSASCSMSSSSTCSISMASAVKALLSDDLRRLNLAKRAKERSIGPTTRCSPTPMKFSRPLPSAPGISRRVLAQTEELPEADGISSVLFAVDTWDCGEASLCRACGKTAHEIRSEGRIAIYTLDGRAEPQRALMVAEAMGFGRVPILQITDQPPPPAIKNGQNAHVVERGNFQKIAQIIRGHQLAPHGLVEMSKAAHSTYLQSLANEQMLAAEYVDACE